MRGWKKKREEPITPETTTKDEDAVVRTETFYPYFVYSNEKNEIIGSIQLTEDQAKELNKFMAYQGKQDISFLRM